jgi:Protein of unknown function (DUF2726)
MDFNTTALVAAVLLLATVLLMRRRDRGDPRGAAAKRDNLDTVADWPPTSVRVMTVAERESYELLRKALPGIMVLAQVPLSRFIRVPTRHSYSEWMQRVGSLSADLLLCDSGSKVLAVVDVRSAAETDRARRRHDRLARVLKAAGVKVYTWREDELPTMAQVRALVGAELERQAGVVRPATLSPATSRLAPQIPVPDIDEVLAEGDQATYDAGMEPVPSGFYADLDAAPAGRR